MEPNQGFNKAKQLLQQHYGNDILIASAYQEKALNWPTLKSEDRPALREYASFMRGCGNATTDTEAEWYEQYIPHANSCLKTSIQAERKWRSVAYDHYERTKERAKFIQLVNIIERKANMAGEPLFGNDGKDVMPKEDSKKIPKTKSGSAYKSSFTCLYCKKDHFAIVHFNTFVFAAIVWEWTSSSCVVFSAEDKHAKEVRDLDLENAYLLKEPLGWNGAQKTTPSDFYITMKA